MYFVRGCGFMPSSCPRRNWVAGHPTAGVKNPAGPKSGGLEARSEDDVQTSTSGGQRAPRSAFGCTPSIHRTQSRRCCTLGRQHMKDGVATIRTEKTGTESAFPSCPPWRRLCGQPNCRSSPHCRREWSAADQETFGNTSAGPAMKWGLNGKSAHGVRKIGATRAAEAGATVAELEALFGWSGGAMASHYTRTADRKRLAKLAAERSRTPNARTLTIRCGEKPKEQ